MIIATLLVFQTSFLYGAKKIEFNEYMPGFDGKNLEEQTKRVIKRCHGTLNGVRKIAREVKKAKGDSEKQKTLVKMYRYAEGLLRPTSNSNSLKKRKKITEMMDKLTQRDLPDETRDQEKVSSNDHTECSAELPTLNLDETWFSLPQYPELPLRLSLGIEPTELPLFTQLNNELYT